MTATLTRGAKVRTTAVEFAAIARALGQECRRLGIPSDLVDGCVAAANVSEAEGDILRVSLWEAAGLALAA